MMKRLRIRLFCHHADLFSAFCGEFSPAFERVFLVRRSSSIALRQFPFLPRRRPPTIVRLRFLVASMSGKPGEGDGSPGKKEASPSSNTKSDDEDIACEVTCQPEAEPSTEEVKEETTDIKQKSKEITSPIGMTKNRIIAADEAEAIDQDVLEEPGMEENPVESGSGSEDEVNEKVTNKADSKYTSINDKLKSFLGSNSGYATRKATFIQERERLRAMTVDEKRKLYANSDYVTLEDIETWPEFYSNNVKSLKTLYPEEEEVEKALTFFPGIEVDEELNRKVSLFEGDITTLEIDGIVNAANKSLFGGGGVDGAIHQAAGSLLREECRTLYGCETGDAKTTCGYRLPAKYVIHTVGPMRTSRSDLQRCYVSCFREMANHNMKSIAFCCISTGIYGYPNELAAQDALMSTRKYLTELKGARMIDAVDRIIFCLHVPIDVEVYQSWMQVYFPTEAVSVSD